MSNLIPKTNLMEASMQWASRPDDQRFLTLADLKASVERRKGESWTRATSTQQLRVIAPPDERNIAVELFDPSKGEKRVINPTNWAFGQLAQYAGAPASYLRKLPAMLTSINLQWGLENLPIRDDILVLGQSNGEQTLRALTSATYGRVWDIQVVQAVERVNRAGNWKIPAASYSGTNPKRATTLYASDRDVFLFLVDPEHPVEVNGETLFKGFMVWNSEVGAATFGLTTFLYRYVCDNRIVWGATNVQELRIRHTSGAPDRFAGEGARWLNQYANERSEKTAEIIRKAQAYELQRSQMEAGEREGTADERWQKWLKNRGFSTTQAKVAIDSAKAEEGEARSLWNIVNGITASARAIPYTDERVKLEAMAGKLMEVVSGS